MKTKRKRPGKPGYIFTANILRIPRKVRSDAILDNLAPERQLEIMRKLSPGPRNKSYAEIVAWLASVGVTVKTGTLRYFRQRYLERHQYRREREGRLDEPDEFAGQRLPGKLPARKVTAASPLRNLTPEQQAEVMRLVTPGPDNKSYTDACATLARQGVHATPQTLQSFRVWYLENEQIAALGQETDRETDEERRMHPEWSEDELFRRGQRRFSERAMKLMDAVVWTAIQKLHLKAKDQAFVKRRVEIEERREVREDRKAALEENKAERQEKAEAEANKKPAREDQEAEIRAVMGLKRKSPNAG